MLRYPPLLDKEKTPRLYIAGPMSGYPDSNVAAFNEAEHRFTELGYGVFSPASPEYNLKYNPDTDGPSAQRHAMKMDLPLVLSVDALVMLENWELSRGACLEAFVATSCDIPLYNAHSLEHIEFELRYAARAL